MTHIYDLIYFERDKKGYNDFKMMVPKMWPDAVIEDASDEIHGYRLSIEADVEEDAYYLWLVHNEIFGNSFNGQMILQAHHDYAKHLVELLNAEEEAN